MYMFRQGDVMIREVRAIPDEARAHPRTGTTLAYGEVTGHAHRLVNRLTPAQLYGSDDAHFFAEIAPGTLVEHQEHAATVLPDHVRHVEVIVQREFSEAGDRKVAD